MVIAISAGTPIYLAREGTDLRKAFDGLCNLVRFSFRLDPFGGGLFVFFNRRANRVKVLQWDGNGFWLHTKRLERGTFERWQPSSTGERHVVIERAQLLMLLEGIDLRRAKLRSRFARSLRIDGGGRHPTDEAGSEVDRRRAAR